MSEVTLQHDQPPAPQPPPRIPKKAEKKQQGDIRMAHRAAEKRSGGAEMINDNNPAVAAMDRLEDATRTVHQDITDGIQGMIDLIDHWKKEHGIQ